MSKLVTLFAIVALAAAPAFACPHEDGAAKDQAPRTAEKAKPEGKATAAPAPTKDKAKASDPKTARPAEPKPAPKAPAANAKVSSK